MMPTNGNVQDGIHSSEVPTNGAVIKVVQTDSGHREKKSQVSSNCGSSLQRQRASTLGVIAELPQEQNNASQNNARTPQFTANRLSNRRRPIPKSPQMSISDLHASSSPIVAGQVKAFGDTADRGQLKIEDRVVLHPGDSVNSTVIVRDVEFRMVADISYLIPVPTNVPLKLAALLGGKGLRIFSAVLEAEKKCRKLWESSPDQILKILIVCNDEFSMVAVQLMSHILKDMSGQMLIAMATMTDDGIMWIKKNLPTVKIVQWNGDAYDQVLIERTSLACKGNVDVVVGCLGLGAPLQRSLKCLKKDGVAFVTEAVNEKVWKPLLSLANQQHKEIVRVDTGSPEDLQNLVHLVAAENIQPSFLQEDKGVPVTTKKPSSNMNKVRTKSFSSIEE